MKPSNTDTQQIERDIEGQAQPGASAEQAADLAALQAAASPQPVPGAPVADQAAEQGPPEPSAAALQVAALAVGILRPVIAYAVPSLRAAPDELWAPIPGGVAGILDHYGVGLEALDNPWARLAMACAPLAAYAAVQAMQAPPKTDPTEGGAVLDLTASKPAPEPAEPVGQKTVTFGGAPA